MPDNASYAELDPVTRENLTEVPAEVLGRPYFPGGKAIGVEFYLNKV